MALTVNRPAAAAGAQGAGATSTQAAGNTAGTEQAGAEAAGGTAAATPAVEMVPVTDDAGNPVLNDDGTPKMRKKRTVAKRTKYVGGTRNEAGLITELPTDYDRNKMLPPPRKSFVSAALFYQWRADECTKMATKFAAKAAEETALGDSGQRAEKKRILKVMAEANDLKAKLLAEIGQEALDALLATVTPAPAAGAVGAAS